MSSPGTTQDRAGVTNEAEHLEELLDEALIETFPASDPVAISIEQRHAMKPMPQNKTVESTHPNGSTVVPE
jgi:hypothetical protein